MDTHVHNYVPLISVQPSLDARVRTYLESTLTFLMCAHSMEKELERADAGASAQPPQPSPPPEESLARVLQLYRELLPMAHYAKQLVLSELELLSARSPGDPLYLVRIRLLLVLRCDCDASFAQFKPHASVTSHRSADIDLSHFDPCQSLGHLSLSMCSIRAEVFIHLKLFTLKRDQLQPGMQASSQSVSFKTFHLSSVVESAQLNLNPSIYTRTTTNQCVQRLASEMASLACQWSTGPDALGHRSPSTSSVTSGYASSAERSPASHQWHAGEVSASGLALGSGISPGLGSPAGSGSSGSGMQHLYEAFCAQEELERALRKLSALVVQLAHAHPPLVALLRAAQDAPLFTNTRLSLLLRYANACLAAIP